MGCALLSLLFGMPRLALFLLWWLYDGWLAQAYEVAIWPILGFFFMPWTTLAFAYGMNEIGGPGVVPPLGWLLTIIAVALDLGILGGGARSRRRRRD